MSRQGANYVRVPASTKEDDLRHGDVQDLEPAQNQAKLFTAFQDLAKLIVLYPTFLSRRCATPCVMDEFFPQYFGSIKYPFSSPQAPLGRLERSAGFPLLGRWERHLLPVISNRDLVH